VILRLVGSETLRITIRRQSIRINLLATTKKSGKIKFCQQGQNKAAQVNSRALANHLHLLWKLSVKCKTGTQHAVRGCHECSVCTKFEEGLFGEDMADDKRTRQRATDLRDILFADGVEERVEVNQRHLIDKILARYRFVLGNRSFILR